MANKEVKNIVFKGIERVNKRTNCNEGAMEEIINLRPEGNSWQNVGNKKRITSRGISIGADEDYQIIIHPTSRYDYYIVKTKDNVYLYDKNTEKKVGTLLQADDIVSVSYLQDVLIVCTKEKKYFFLYKLNTKEYKQLSFDNIGTTIWARGIPMYKKQSKTRTSNNWDTGFNSPTTLSPWSAVASDDDKEKAYLFYKHNYNKSNKLYPIIKYTDNSPSYDYDNISKVAKATLGYMQDDLSGINSVYDTYNKYGVFNEYIIDAKIKDTFYGLSFYRLAFRLYDGTYIGYSNITYADTNGDDIATKGSILNNFPVTIICKLGDQDAKWGDDMYTDVVVMYNPNGTHFITIDLADSQDAIMQLMEQGIILSMDLFMTKPIFSVDFDKECKLLSSKIKSYNTGYCVEVEFQRNETQFKEQLLNGTYYRVKSFDKDYFKKEITTNSSKRFSFLTTKKDIEALEGNKILPSPQTDNEIMFKSSYLYNDKQHLYDLYYNIFKGYDYALDRDLLYITSQTDATQKTKFYELIKKLVPSCASYTTEQMDAKVDGMYYTIEGAYDNEQFSIKHKINYPDNFIIQNNDNTFSLSLPKLFSYPLNDKVEFSIIVLMKDGTDTIQLYNGEFEDVYGGENTVVICKKKSTEDKFFGVGINAIYCNIPQNASLNKTFDLFAPMITDNYDSHLTSHFNTIQKNTNTENDIEKITFEEITKTNSTNIMQLTETDNPFVLPSEDNYSFEQKDNIIMAVCSNTGLTTDRNFGTYPLYVFTTKGIFALSVGSGNISYSDITRINISQIINPNVLSTPLGIMYLAKQGLCIINGKQVSCISDLVKGSPSVTNTENLNIVKSFAPVVIDYDSTTFKPIKEKDLSRIVDTNMLTPITSEFLQEIKDAQFYYNEENNEIGIVVKNKYTYIFNLNYKVFYKRSDYFQVENGNTLSLGEVYAKAKKIHLYEISEEYDTSKDICKTIAIITKPFLLDTRQYKHIERMILNCQWTNENDFYIFLFASNDGVNYNILKQVHQPKTSTQEYYKQDYYLSRALRGAKYCMLWVLSRSWADTHIANSYMEFRQVRNTQGIR